VQHVVVTEHDTRAHLRRWCAPPVETGKSGGIIVRMPSLPAVSRTAIGVARARATETARPDRLFSDPYAAAFVEASGRDAAIPDPSTLTDEQRRWRAGIAFHVVMRTRFFDEYLEQAVAAGCNQVVVLGAGLDARAYRLDWPPSLTWFEVDLPDVHAFKKAVLDARGATASCDRRPVTADLTLDWSETLTEAGFDRSVATAWLAEGLLVYLEPQTAAHVLDIVTTLSTSGSRLAVERGDVTSRVADTDPQDRPDDASALWRGGLGRNPAERLAEHGWQVTEHEIAAVAAAYGRPAPEGARSGFVTAAR
jgi:methyltransferase (TIGR00027 family)